jgi:hypothetical protein
VSKEKVYIGDGVFASNDGMHVILETERENGINIIYLDDVVLDQLFRYIERIHGVEITMKEKSKGEA